MKNKHVKKLVLSALFLALAYVLPFFTGNIPQIGSMLLPMHIPVLLCGFVCGPAWGAAVGFLAPLLNSFIFARPALFPQAVSMMAELAVYGLVSGLLYRRLPRKLPQIYISLLSAMLLGRIVWGCVRLLCAGLSGTAFTFGMFISGSLLTAIPGIVIQLFLIPLLVLALEQANMMHLK